MTTSNASTYPIHVLLGPGLTAHMLHEAGLKRDTPVQVTLTVEGELTAAQCGNLFGPVPDIKWAEILGQRAEATGQVIRLADAWGTGLHAGWAHRLTELLSGPEDADKPDPGRPPRPKQPEEVDRDTAAALVRLTAGWPDTPYILADEEVRAMLAHLQLELQAEDLLATSAADT